MKTALDDVILRELKQPNNHKKNNIENLASCLHLSEQNISRSSLDEHHLSYDEGHSILAALPSELQINELGLWNQRKACGQALRETASSSFLESLKRLKNKEINAFVLRNFPLDFKLPPTPTNGFTDIASVLKPLEFLSAIFEHMQVSPVGYAGENNNDFIRHVVPSDQALREESSHGSLEPLQPHIDNGHLPIGHESCEHDCPAPHYIIWLGLRCDIKVPTIVVLLDDILATLPDDVISSLRKPIFDAHRPPSFGSGAVQQRLAPLIVPDGKGGFCTRHGFAKATDPESNYALQLFSLAAGNSALAHRIFLLPGDVLIINNQKTVHAREAFRPRYNGADRWLLRFYGIEDFQDRWMSEHQLPYLANG